MSVGAYERVVATSSKTGRDCSWPSGGYDEDVSLI